VAYAAAIRAAESWHWHESLSHGMRDATLQIQRGFRDECFQETGMRQEIVDVPASGCLDAFQHQDVAINALEAAGTPRGTGVRIEASGKVNDAQGPDCYLLCTRQRKY